jgi:Amt family ammonium transporter
MIDEDFLEKIRRYVESYSQENLESHSVQQVVLGTMILWVSWLLFNSAGHMILSTKISRTHAEYGFFNTLLAPSCGGVVSLLLKKKITQDNSEKSYSITALTNGILAGAVSITAGCNRVEPYAAIIIGVSGALIYALACKIITKLKIDDPLEAFQIHAVCGFWGLICTGLFHNEEGLLYSGSGKMLLANFVGFLVITAWTGILSAIIFTILNKTNCLRVDVADEILGLDLIYHSRAPDLNLEALKDVIRRSIVVKKNGKFVRLEEFAIEDEKVCAPNEKGTEEKKKKIRKD